MTRTMYNTYFLLHKGGKGRRVGVEERGYEEIVMFSLHKVYNLKIAPLPALCYLSISRKLLVAKLHYNSLCLSVRQSVSP